jgi:hypothetical protein
LDHSVDVWAPAGEGTFPVVYFIPGLAGKVTLEQGSQFQALHFDKKMYLYGSFT